MEFKKVMQQRLTFFSEGFLAIGNEVGAIEQLTLASH